MVENEVCIGEEAILAWSENLTGDQKVATGSTETLESEDCGREWRVKRIDRREGAWPQGDQGRGQGQIIVGAL